MKNKLWLNKLHKWKNKLISYKILNGCFKIMIFLLLIISPLIHYDDILFIYRQFYLFKTLKIKKNIISCCLNKKLFSFYINSIIYKSYLIAFLQWWSKKNLNLFPKLLRNSILNTYFLWNILNTRPFINFYILSFIKNFKVNT